MMASRPFACVARTKTVAPRLRRATNTATRQDSRRLGDAGHALTLAITHRASDGDMLHTDTVVVAVVVRKVEVVVVSNLQYWLMLRQRSAGGVVGVNVHSALLGLRLVRCRRTRSSLSLLASLQLLLAFILSLIR